MSPEPLDIQEMRLVVVDDSEPNVALLRRLLNIWGFANVTAVTDSTKVAEICEADPPDLLLLDLQMPEPDGFAILDRLHDQIHAAVSLPVLVLTGSSVDRAKHRALEAGARDFLTKPFDVDEIEARVRNLLELRRLQIAQRSNEQGLERRVQERTAQLEAARMEIVQRLARAGEFRDDETGEHTRRVGETSRQIAERLGAEDGMVEKLQLAAPLHDIGKIAVPDAILLKPGRLTEDEISVMQTHTTTGAHLLAGSSSTLLDLACSIALTHHERWDGTGYPHGLAGDDIPLHGRIVAIADVFDALTHERPYKEAWSVEEAVAEISGQAARHFDPAVVAAFMDLEHAALV